MTESKQIIIVQPIPPGVTFSNAVSKTQSSKLERLFPLKRGKRDVRALSFELSKMSSQLGLAVIHLININNET